jgi:hypothetical protein
MVTNIKPWAEAPRRNPTADELRQIDEFVRKYETAVNARDSKSLRQLCYNERVFLGLTLGHLFEQTDAERWRWLESERPVDAVFPAEQEWRIDVESGFAIGYQRYEACGVPPVPLLGFYEQGAKLLYVWGPGEFAMEVDRLPERFRKRARGGGEAKTNP